MKRTITTPALEAARRERQAAEEKLASATWEVGKHAGQQPSTEGNGGASIAQAEGGGDGPAREGETQ